MASAAQSPANRLNAQKSTKPGTRPGVKAAMRRTLSRPPRAELPTALERIPRKS